MFYLLKNGNVDQNSRPMLLNEKQESVGSGMDEVSGKLKGRLFHFLYLTIL